jgi:hypothetical protein
MSREPFNPAAITTVAQKLRSGYLDHLTLPQRLQYAPGSAGNDGRRASNVASP